MTSTSGGPIQVRMRERDKRFFRLMGQLPRHMRREMEWAVRHMTMWAQREMQSAFRDQREPGGARWQPNRGRYARLKASFGQTKVGVLSGELQNSFHGEMQGALRGVASSDMLRAVWFTTGAGAPGLHAFTKGGKTYFFYLHESPPERPILPAYRYTEQKAGKTGRMLLDRGMRRLHSA